MTLGRLVQISYDHTHVYQRMLRGELTRRQLQAHPNGVTRILRALAATAKLGDVERFKGAPHLAPMRRLDETLAARKPKLVWKRESGAP